MKIYVTKDELGCFGYTTDLSEHDDIIKDVLSRFGASGIFNQTIIEDPEYTAYSFETETVEEEEDIEGIAKQVDEIISAVKNTKHFKTIVLAATLHHRHNDETEFRQLLWKIVKPQFPLRKKTTRFSMTVYIDK